MKPCVQSLMKILVSPKAFGTEIASGDEVEAAKDAFLNEICKHVENMLDGRSFLISAHEPTVIDIIFYSEMSTVILLMRIKGLKRMFPGVSKWIGLMGDIDEMDDIIENLVQTIDKHELEWLWS